MWFPILITIFLISVLTYYIRKVVGKSNENPLILIFPVVALVAWLAVWISIYTFSVQTVANMKDFFGSIKSAYERPVTVTATEGIEIKVLKQKIKESENPPTQMFDFGEFAYLKLAPVASECVSIMDIIEFRNKIKWYNATLESYKMLNYFWFTKGFVADVPSDLKPITVQ